MSNNILKIDCPGSSPENDTITVKLAHYKEILHDSLMLQALQEGGIDNWERYGEALKRFQELEQSEGFTSFGD